MSERKNAGYTITDSIHIGNAEFVIGNHPKAPSPYVTWECSGGTNYFWGHYFPDRRSAEKNLLDRAQAELNFVMQQEEQVSESTKGSIPEKADNGDKYDAMKIEYEPFYLFGHDCLYTDKRIDRHSVPKGMYAYDIRYDDDGDPSMLEKNVAGHFYGTVILNQSISLGKYGCKAIRLDDYGFHEEKLRTLSDFMETHPPKRREPER